MDDLAATVQSFLDDTVISDPGATIRGPTEGPADLEQLPLISDDLELGATLGSGGMGAVLQAEARALRRQVAVKVLHPSAEPETARALLEEARVAGDLEHPNIVPVHALGRDTLGRPMLVMKKVEGTSWKKHLDRDPHRERLDFHLNVLTQVGNAIEFAHSKGYLHRDLKPENVMIGSFSEIYVVDWGLALRLDQRDRYAPDEAPIVGTPNFMAPEMFLRDLSAVDERTDVYLLGGLLHYLLTGEPPHTGELSQVVESALSSEPRTYGSDVPPNLAAIARRALQRSAEDRFASAAEFREALVSYIQNRAAETIAMEAQRSLDELRGLLQSGAEDVDPAVLYKVFGACRFGFQQAAAVSPSFRTAGEERREATELMVEYELARKNDEGARVLAAELDPVPEGLLERIEQVRKAREEAAEELEELRDLRKEHRLQGRARAFVVMAMAAGFVIVGAVSFQIMELFDRFPSLDFNLGVRIAMLVGVLIAIGLGRRFVRNNEANRRLALTVLIASISLIACALIGGRLGLQTEEVLTLDLLLLASIGAVAGAAIDRRLWPPALAMGGFSFAMTLTESPSTVGGLYIAALHVALALVIVAWLRRPR